MPSFTRSHSKLLGLAFSRTAAPTVIARKIYANGTREDKPAPAGMKLNGNGLSFSLAVAEDDGPAEVSVESAEWQFAYDPPVVMFLNQSWPMGTEAMANAHLSVNGQHKSANQVDFKFDSATKTLTWKAGASTGTVQLNDKTPVYYAMLRLSDLGDTGTLKVGGSTLKL
jgi:hypothetical protein